MNTVYENKGKCCGCTACFHICPVDAITMEADSKGFLYPYIDSERCIDCGKCKKVCPFQNDYEKTFNIKEVKVYAVKHKDEAVRLSSTSGGAFSAISDYVLENSGLVFGVAFNENFKAVYKKAQTKEERDDFKGSKYVQSYLGDTFSNIKDFLYEGKKVLFSGNPCIIAGLRRYLDMENVRSENLILCDIVCHGVPSPLVFKEHLDSLKRKTNSNVLEYRFRDKKYGWRGSNVSINLDNKEYANNSFANSYSNLYFAGLITRKSCHNCKFTNFNRPSDITIGDYWGIEKNIPDFVDDSGVSLMLVNSIKGQQLFENIKKDIEFRESSVNKCIQPQLEYPPQSSAKEKDFWADYDSYGYEYIIKKYGGLSVKGKAKRVIKTVLVKTGLYKFLNRLIKDNIKQ